MNLIRYLHESDPLRYPMTKALEIDAAMTVDNAIGEPERILDHNKENSLTRVYNNDITFNFTKNHKVQTNIKENMQFC